MIDPLLTFFEIDPPFFSSRITVCGSVLFQYLSVIITLLYVVYQYSTSTTVVYDALSGSRHAPRCDMLPTYSYTRGIYLYLLIVVFSPMMGEETTTGLTILTERTGGVLLLGHDS